MLLLEIVELKINRDLKMKNEKKIPQYQTVAADTIKTIIPIAIWRKLIGLNPMASLPAGTKTNSIAI